MALQTRQQGDCNYLYRYGTFYRYGSTGWYACKAGGRRLIGRRVSSMGGCYSTSSTCRYFIGMCSHLQACIRYGNLSYRYELYRTGMGPGGPGTCGTVRYHTVPVPVWGFVSAGTWGVTSPCLRRRLGQRDQLGIMRIALHRWSHILLFLILFNNGHSSGLY